MKSKISVNSIVKAGLFIALSVVFSRLLSIQTPFLVIGFGQLPIIVASIVLGPWIGFIVGASSDLIGFFLFTGGTFFPGFTLSAGLIGLVPGLLCRYAFRRTSTLPIIIGITINHFIINMILNTFWLTILGYSLFAITPQRLVKQVVMTPINIILTIIILKLPMFKNDIYNNRLIKTS